MGDTNSYRRKSEKYKKVMLDYESELGGHFFNCLRDLKDELSGDRRSFLANRVESIHNCLLRNMRELRGY